MTNLPALSEPDDLRDRGVDLFPARLLSLLVDTGVSNQMLTLLYSLDWHIVAMQSGKGDRPAFIQQRDVAHYANLDRKTVFTTRDARGRTLIERAGVHGVVYEPGSNERLIERASGPVGEAGSYWWPVLQTSPTDPRHQDVQGLQEGVLDLPEPIEGEDRAPQACGGNLHSHREDGLRALLHPGAPLWTSHRAGLAGWRATCLLVVSQGPGPLSVLVKEIAELLGMSVSNAGRVLHRLAGEHLASQTPDGWVFDTARLLFMRERCREGKRDPVLGLDPRDRKTGTKDKGDAIENRFASKDYVRTKVDGARVGAEKWFMKHREGLLAAAEALAGDGPGCRADPIWVEHVRGLTTDTVEDYLRRSLAAKAWNERVQEPAPAGGAQEEATEPEVLRDLDDPWLDSLGGPVTWRRMQGMKARAWALPVTDPGPKPVDEDFERRLRLMSDRANNRQATSTSAVVVEATDDLLDSAFTTLESPPETGVPMRRA